MNPLKVADSYRKNELSIVPGGSTVTLHYTDNKTLIYDKVKDPNAYLRKAFRNKTVKYATVEGRDIYP